MNGQTIYCACGKERGRWKLENNFQFSCFLFVLGPSVYLDGKHCIDVHGISIFGMFPPYVRSPVKSINGLLA